MKNKFVMTQAVCSEGMELLKEKADVFVADAPDPNAYLGEMQEADALIVRIASCDRHVIENSPMLKVIGRTGSCVPETGRSGGRGKPLNWKERPSVSWAWGRLEGKPPGSVQGSA